MKYLIGAAIAAFSVSTTAADVMQEVRGESGAAVLLYEEQGICRAPARRADYVSPSGEVIPGCFKLIGVEIVQIVFVDGDALQLPIAAFKPPKKT
jgi:hypothetical protein